MRGPVSPMDLPKLLQRSFKFRHQAPQQLRACPKRPSTLLWVLALVTVVVVVLAVGPQWRAPGRGRGQEGAVRSSLKVEAAQGGCGVIIEMGRAESRVRVMELREGAGVRVVGSRAGGEVAEMVEWARGRVAEARRAATRVFVVATGGWERAAPDTVAAVLREGRRAARASGFAFRDDWALVLHGRDEGAYEWLAANYARAVVRSDHTDTVGVLNLKDESTQVTFVADREPPFAYSHRVELWGVTHNLYSYSFDKLGLATASTTLLKLLHARIDASPHEEDEGSKVVLDPCTPRGFGGPNNFGSAIEQGRAVKTFPTVPSGNFSLCRAELLGLLQQGQQACHEKKCPAGTVFVPELHGNFIAAGQFFQTSKVLGLPPMASLSDMVAAGGDYCGGEVGNVLKDPFPEYEAARKPCFSAAFIVAFLHDSLGLPVTSSQVLFTDEVNGVPVEWTVGFFLAHLLEKKVGKPAAPIAIWGSVSGSSALHSLGLAASVSGLVVLVVCFVRRWRRPPLKTIYDLQKGRYITSPAAARGR